MRNTKTIYSKKSHQVTGQPTFAQFTVRLMCFSHKNTAILGTWLVLCILCYLHPAHELATPLWLTSVMLAGRFRFKFELPEQAEQLIRELLVVDPKLRLGTASRYVVARSRYGSRDVQNHPFFSDFLKIDFTQLENKQVTDALIYLFAIEDWSSRCNLHGSPLLTTEFRSTSTDKNSIKSKPAALARTAAV